MKRRLIFTHRPKLLNLVAWFADILTWQEWVEAFRVLFGFFVTKTWLERKSHNRTLVAANIKINIDFRHLSSLHFTLYWSWKCLPALCPCPLCYWLQCRRSWGTWNSFFAVPVCHYSRPSHAPTFFTPLATIFVTSSLSFEVPGVTDSPLLRNEDQ